MSCPVCGCEKILGRFSVTRKEADMYSAWQEGEYRPAEYAECAGCRAMYWLADEQWERIYDGFAYEAETGDAEDFIKTRFQKIVSLPPEQSDNAQRIDRILRFINEHDGPARTDSRHVLDVGAGMGVFLFKFPENGWGKSAVEPDPVACKHMRSILPNADVHQGYIDEVTLERVFDLITLNRMLEHVAYPETILKRVKTLLAPGGVAYVELPDTRAYHLNGPHDPDFGYGHYVVFSPMALVTAAQKSGLDVLALDRVTEPSGKHTIYGFFGASPRPIKE